ncbi:MAG: sulfatase-like hydrolase/transferase [Armatimonadota bacterium]
MPTANRPNIVIFNPDHWRGDVLGHMGNAGAVTPHLDAVAAEGVSFRNAYCQNPVCTPSRCSFMSGWYPHVRGHRTMQHMLHPERGEPNLLATLKDNGYFVWWGGKNDLVPAQHGYNRYCDVKFSATEEDFRRWGHQPAQGLHGDLSWRGEPGSDSYYSFYAGKLSTGDDDLHFDNDWHNVFGALDVINASAANRQPFCLYLPLEYPHPPYGVEDPWFSMIDREKLPPCVPTPENWDGKPSLIKGLYERYGMERWTEDRWTELRATFYGMCARLDHQFGLLMQALRETGVYDNTTVFVFADHGDFTGDYGLVEKTQNTFEDCLTRVPFIIKPPAGTPVQPRVSEAMVELIDFPATVEALTGITPDHTHFGRSLLPVLAGETDEHRDAVFCEGGRLDGEMHCSESNTATLGASGLYWPRASLQAHIPEHTKATMCRTREFKYVRRLYESDELYDLRQDPGETHNHINDPAYAGILADLKDRLLTFYQETCDVVPFEMDRRW